MRNTCEPSPVMAGRSQHRVSKFTNMRVVLQEIVMKARKMFIAAVGLVAVGATVIYQQARIDRFAAEAATLRKQAQQPGAVQDQAERPTGPEPSQEMGSNSVAALTAGQFSELLRLRGEVGVLRAQLAEAAKRADDNATRQRYSGRATEMNGLTGELLLSRSNSATGFGRALAPWSSDSDMSEDDPAQGRWRLDSVMAAWAQHDTDAALQWVEQNLSDPGERDLALNAIRSVAPVGIGAELALQDSYAVINRLVPGSPAELSGQLQSGDRIVAVAQGDNAFLDVRHLPLSELVQAIRGAPGTLIRLQVLPAAAPPDSPPATVTLFRDQIKHKKQG
jgi:hypothetical protein